MRAYPQPDIRGFKGRGDRHNTWLKLGPYTKASPNFCAIRAVFILLITSEPIVLERSALALGELNLELCSLYTR